MVNQIKRVMKELSIEEKAKAYDEAYKRVAVRFGSNVADEIFLKESEDERIRKELLNAFKEAADSLYMVLSPLKRKAFIAWLEKQGEQKSWSEEDEEIYRKCICAMRASACGFPEEEKFVEQVDNWLKSLKDRVQLQNITYYNPYKEVVESIAEMCKHYDTASHSGLRDFYDNVKVKCKEAKEFDAMFPQKQWKPSEEQMDALKLSAYCQNKQLSKVLFGLYQDLKKLMEG